MNLKYKVNYLGRSVTLREYADMTGLPYATVRRRAYDGRPINAPVRRSRRPQEDVEPYTYREVKNLYRNFCGQNDELRMLMDFTGLNRNDAVFLLKELKQNITQERGATA